ncbi:LysR family transcriptional regulator [Sphingomonas sp. MG17]|uniref:LysR family transcriptional regulator n=1 Tax=Sphingomonas tagetis TaxID=2949092 RepID=A0A9X2HU14_9SPHN|nr:LysR family transcriptional regulator [Sphingomonas tagetis]MCP3732620.1 LysR family transcriptional regulator [Sphingomonas tagetis]
MCDLLAPSIPQRNNAAKVDFARILSHFGMKMLDGDCLAAFVAIAEARSFSRAADRLGIVQSVASKRLLRLEDQLGARLLDRRRKSDVHLTRTGRIFLDEARATLAQLAKAERLGVNLARGRSGPINIGYIFSAAMSGMLTGLLANLRTLSPELVLHPRLMETPAQLAELAAGRLDIGLVRPRPSYPPGCRAAIVHSEPLKLCVSEDHVLANSASVHPRALAGEKFVLPQFHEQVGLIDSLDEVCRAGGFELSALTRTDDFVTAAALAAAGEGVVLAPASLATLGIARLRFLNIVSLNCQISTALVYREDAPDFARAMLERKRSHCTGD